MSTSMTSSRIPPSTRMKWETIRSNRQFGGDGVPGGIRRPSGNGSPSENAELHKQGLPVVPIIRMFLDITSSHKLSSNCRRQDRNLAPAGQARRRPLSQVEATPRSAVSAATLSRSFAASSRSASASPARKNATMCRRAPMSPPRTASSTPRNRLARTGAGESAPDFPIRSLEESKPNFLGPIHRLRRAGVRHWAMPYSSQGGKGCQAAVERTLRSQACLRLRPCGYGTRHAFGAGIHGPQQCALCPAPDYVPLNRDQSARTACCCTQHGT
jgi:hypothetical protein